MEDIINFLRIGKLNIIGSYTDKNKHYYSDIDIDDIIDIEPELFLNKLQYKLKNIKSNSNIFFIEFKSGVLGGRSVKWSYNEIMDGFKYIDNKKYDLLGAMVNYDNAKLDLIILDNVNNLIPTSISYKFKNKIIDKKGYESSLYLEALRLEENKQYFEAYKKWYLYYKSKGDRKKINTVLDILNSNLGLIYTKYYKLKEIKRLLESDNNYKIKDIENNLLDIKKGLPQDINYVMLPLVNSSTEQRIKNNIDKAIMAISNYINNTIKNLD